MLTKTAEKEENLLIKRGGKNLLTKRNNLLTKKEKKNQLTRRTKGKNPNKEPY